MTYDYYYVIYYVIIVSVILVRIIATCSHRDGMIGDHDRNGTMPMVTHAHFHFHFRPLESINWGGRNGLQPSFSQ